jgi:hypothetical protein
VDQRPAIPPTTPPTGRSAASVAPPRSVELAVRAAWGLVGVMALVVVLLAVFPDDVIGAWASGHEGAREVFDRGGRAELERAGFAPPSFVPVAATMLVVGAMLVWVLAAVLRQGHRWGQLGLFALVLGSAYVSIALGLVLEPPPLFVLLAVVSLLVEGVVVVCLWHPDTRGFLAGPWADADPATDGPGESPGDRSA